jgi:hypothetical protein
VVQDRRALGEQQSQVSKALEDRAIEPELGGRRWGLEAIAGDHHRAQLFAEPRRCVDALFEEVECGVHAAELVD